MKKKFNAGPRARVNASRQRDVEAEKVVARSMTNLFVVVLVVIVAFLIYLWAIGKFG